MPRGQLSLSIVEAGVGVVFVLAITMGFVVGVTPADTESRQLDGYAEDVATMLANEPPRHGAETRLAEVTHSPAAFRRERAALDRRIDRLLGDNLMYRLVTRHGAVGYPRPASVPTGQATVPTAGGDVSIWVWYV